MFMKIMQKKFLLIGLLLFASKLYSQQNETESNTMKKSRNELIVQLTDYLNKEMDKRNIVGMSVSVIDSEGELISDGFGFANKQKHIKANDSTLFPIASITKTFTGIAVMQLVEKGLIDLDKPIGDYIQNLSMPAGEEKTITPRMLLTHHSGIQGNILYNWLLPEITSNPLVYNEIVPLINSIGTIFTPGKMHSYSNSGYALLGVLIQEVSKQSYTDYVRDNILSPLGMKTSIMFSGEPTDEIITCGYDKGETLTMPMKLSIPAGGMAISAKDATIYLKALIKNYYTDGPLLKSETFKEMLSPQNQYIQMDKGFSIGLTWFIQSPFNNLDTKYASHRGELPPYHSMVIILPELKIGVLIAINTNKAASSPNEIAHRIISILYKYHTGKVIQPYVLPQISKEKVIIDKKFEGFYPNVFMGPIEVKTKREKVLLKSLLIPVPMVLYPLADGTFALEAKLFGFITIPVQILKSVQLDFREINGKSYIFWIFENSLQNPEMKVEPIKIPSEYSDYIGKYKVINMKNSSRVVKNIELARLKNCGFLVLKYNFLGRYNFNIAINPINESNAKLAGEGYFVGEKIRWELTDNKVKMYWSGLILEKEK